MQLEIWAANVLAGAMADLLTGGRADVFDSAGVRLAACPFAGFAKPRNGALSAFPFPPAVAEADGTPTTFVAFDQDGTAVLYGTAGYKDNEPKPEMKFKTRVVVKDADVLIEDFVFSLVSGAVK